MAEDEKLTAIQEKLNSGEQLDDEDVEYLHNDDENTSKDGE